MLETIKDTKGRILAYCEWELHHETDIRGEDVKYVFVRDLYVAPEIRNQNVIRRFIGIINNKCPNIKYAYWERNKYNMLKMFTIEQLTKHGS